MQKPINRLLGAILSASLLLSGCAITKEGIAGAGHVSQEVLALRDPLAQAMQAQELLQTRLTAGDAPGARVAYDAFAAAFGQVLGPVSLSNPTLAQQMANANTEMQELLGTGKPDCDAVVSRSAVIVEALRVAAREMGLPPTAVAAGDLGPTQAGPATPRAAAPGPTQASTATPRTAAPGATQAGPATPRAAAPGAATPGAAVTPAAPQGQEAARARETKAVTIDVKATEYRFMPPRIEVERGTRVTIRFENVGTEKHEFELEGLREEIRPIPPGTVRELTFVADKAGVFEYSCHVNGHYEKGMRGELVVK